MREEKKCLNKVVGHHKLSQEIQRFSKGLDHYWRDEHHSFKRFSLISTLVGQQAFKNLPLTFNYVDPMSARAIANGPHYYSNDSVNSLAPWRQARSHW